MNAERLVERRERIYLDRFWNEFAGDRSKIDEGNGQLYAQPDAMRAAFAQFRSFRQNAQDNRLLMPTKLTMLVLAIGGEVLRSGPGGRHAQRRDRRDRSGDAPMRAVGSWKSSRPRRSLRFRYSLHRHNEGSSVNENGRAMPIIPEISALCSSDSDTTEISAKG